MPRVGTRMGQEVVMRMESRPEILVRDAEAGKPPRRRRTGKGRSSRFTGMRVHFIGIGGCGMSGLARMLLDLGAVVSGSDPKPNEVTQALARDGAEISDRQDGGLLSDEVELVVRTAAVPPTNPEYLKALGLGLEQLKYAQLLGQVMRERFGIAVSGTHGKTTTTAMAAFALTRCGNDPSYVIGGSVEQLGGSSHSGRGEAFVVEACEFDRSFHALHPKVALITNIEADHLDCYTNGLAEIVESFGVFARRVAPSGQVIANGQDANVREALAGVGSPVQWVGFDEVRELTWAVVPGGIVGGCHTGTIHHQGRPVAPIALSVPGKHNLFNATAAVAACHAAGLDPARAAQSIGQFTGADRRMTRLGEVNGAVVVDDYGHHPTEIRTTLRALREKYAPRRLICVFQPHQHNRTRHLLEDFSTSFVDADVTILPDIYSARDSEADRGSVSALDLLRRVIASGQQALHFPLLEQIVEFLRGEAKPGDLIVTMGAGNVCDVGRELVRG
jgi:UDP-N-acetylmuramate--alanine ligase